MKANLELPERMRERARGMTKHWQDLDRIALEWGAETIDSLRAELTTLRTREAAFREALERYASESYWHEYGCPCGWPGGSGIRVDHVQADCDEGQLAAQVLAAHPTQEGEG